MTGQQPGRDPGERDIVEEFFAGHRAQVPDLPPDDLAWQRIRDGRRDRPGRRGAWTGGLVAAAAALAVVFGPAVLPDPDTPDLAGPQPSPEEPSVAATGPLPTPDVTGDPVAPTSDSPGATTGDAAQTAATPVPEGELSEDSWFSDTTTASPDPEADSGVRFGLAGQGCAGDGFCAVLVRSDDGGLSWSPHADLTQLGPVDRVLFADASRGWVWGAKSALWTTTDGGATWSTVRTGASRVLDVSVRDDILLATTANDGPCATAPCALPTTALVLADPTDTDWTDDVARDLGPAGRAELLDSDTERYVAVSDEAGRVSSLLRLQGDRFETTAPLPMCDPGPVAVAASITDGAQLFALCDDQAGLALQESSNGGRTWAPLNLTVPSFVLGERPPLLASADQEHLVLVGEGNYTVTTDGGQTWSGEAFLPGADSRPAAIEATPSDVLVYPTPDQAGSDLGLWRSTDRGATWEAVTPGG